MTGSKIDGFRLGIYVFEDAEVVDFAGPYGVFSVARRYDPALDVFLVAETLRPVQAQAGFTVLPNYDYDYDTDPELRAGFSRLTRMTAKTASQPAAGLSSLTTLYQRAGLPAWPLPRVLARLYGGDLGFRQPCVYANFVASLDGVTALGPDYPSSGSAISGRNPADRFVMGLLRACAGVVLIGAGTLRATPGHRWTPAHVCPAAADAYAAFRRGLGRDGDPLLAVVTARGDVPAGHPALHAGALILTTAAGACRLRGRLPPACTVVDLGDRPELPPADVLTAVRGRGGGMVLTEGGPRLLGQLAAGGLLDELFLTISPVLAGRGDNARPGLVAGLELLPGRAEPAELFSVRRHGSYLFVRHAMHAAPPAAEPGSG